jgi:hypothetical protein
MVILINITAIRIYISAIPFTIVANKKGQTAVRIEALKDLLTNEAELNQ